MEFIEILSLIIIISVIFLFIYRFFIYKKTSNLHISSLNESKSAQSPYCIPEDGKARINTCTATYTMDINIQKINYHKNQHIFSVCDKSGIEHNNISRSTTACVSFNKTLLDLEKDYKENDITLPNNRLTILIEKGNNNLLVFSKYFNKSKIIKIENIPLNKFVNIEIVFNTYYMEVYVQGKLYNTYILQENVGSESLNIYTTQQGGFVGYIKNVKYIPNNVQDIKNSFSSTNIFLDFLQKI